MPAAEATKSEKSKAPLPEVPLHLLLALTLLQCSALTGLKVCALRAAIAEGSLAYIRSGERGRYLIRRETLEKWMRSREQREAR